MRIVSVREGHDLSMLGLELNSMHIKPDLVNGLASKLGCRPNSTAVHLQFHFLDFQASHETPDPLFALNSFHLRGPLLARSHGP